MKIIGVRGLDEELYRRVKAVAALRGVRLRDAFEEALKLWLSVKPEALASAEEVEREAELNRRAFKKHRGELIKEYEGSYAAFADGELLGVFPTFEEAAAAVEAAGSKQGVIEQLTAAKSRRAEVELGWSLVEL
ncbi:MAG: hypothetical protein QXY49_05355 [Thermofilaceae archaeon]